MRRRQAPGAPDDATTDYNPAPQISGDDHYLKV
jgi:hypothetical protein